jgi:transcription initiation factor TFIIB
LQFSEKLSLPEAVTDEAAFICMRGLERGLEKGRSFAQITASSLYTACREKAFPRTLDDVAAASGMCRDDIAKCYRLLVNELDLKIPVADPAEYLTRVASRLNVSPKAEAGAIEILSRAQKAGIAAGKDPIGFAASAVYLASLLDGLNMTQARAAEAAGVTEVTVRNQSKRLRKLLTVQPGRTPRKRRPSWHELETDRSTLDEAPVRSLA